MQISFGQAITECKAFNRRIAREGWNGKGMFVIYIDPVYSDQFQLIPAPNACGTFSPYYALKTADGSVVPWQPSQTDMCADDWSLLD